MLIIASAGIALPKNQLTKLILAGTDIIRYNFSHYTLEENIDYILRARAETEKLISDAKEAFDLPHNKIRIGDFHKKFITVNESDELILKSDTLLPDDNSFIPVTVEKFGEKVEQNQIIKLSNGQISFQVKEIVDADTVKITILNSGKIEPFEMLNYKYTISDEAMLEKYDTILQAIEPLRPNYIGIAYINKNFFEEIKKLKNYQAVVKNSQVIVKIEEVLDDEEIKTLFEDKSVYAFLLDRGVIGMNSPYELLGLYQKKILNFSKKYNKPVVVNTQILESAVHNFIPSKPEITDITNLVLEGAAAIVLSHHVSHESRPAYAVSIAKKIIKAVTENQEKYLGK